jgi:hypothetical protein
VYTRVYTTIHYLPFRRMEMADVMGWGGNSSDNSKKPGSGQGLSQGLSQGHGQEQGQARGCVAGVPRVGAALGRGCAGNGCAGKGGAGQVTLTSWAGLRAWR